MDVLTNAELLAVFFHALIYCTYEMCVRLYRQYMSGPGVLRSAQVSE
jgi:hypothetical protein